MISVLQHDRMNIFAVFRSCLHQPLLPSGSHLLLLQASHNLTPLQKHIRYLPFPDVIPHVQEGILLESLHHPCVLLPFLFHTRLCFNGAWSMVANCKCQCHGKVPTSHNHLEPL